MNTSNLWKKLREPRYRHALVATNLRSSIPAQIKAMRRKLRMSQEDLANRAGLTQGVISRAENANYGKLTFATVLRIAAGLDVAFVGRFIPFSEFQKLFDTSHDEPVYVTRHEISTFYEEDTRQQNAEAKLIEGEGAHVRRQSVGEYPAALVQLTPHRNTDILVVATPHQPQQSSQHVGLQ